MANVLVLRTSDKDRKSHGGFQWPESGPVECQDWNPQPECGGGLHGLLWGEGDGSLMNWESDAVWQVVEVDEATLVDLGGKVKFPRGNVVMSGDRLTATDYLVSRLCRAARVVGYSLKGGDRSTLTGGYRSTLTGGDRSTLTGGYRSTLTGGDWSTLTGGDRSTLTGGDWSTLTGGDWSTLTGGYGSTLTGGDGSTLTGGYGSTLTGGYRSTLTGGDRSTLCFRFWSGNHRRVVTVYVGENGILPNVQYRLNAEHKPEAVS